MNDLLPQDSNGQKMWETFGAYPWAWLYKSGESAWSTEKRFPLRPRVLLKYWEDPEIQIGVRFGKTTAYALIDVDNGSPYCNPKSIADIQNALETIGINRVVPQRSSWSGGLHLFCPLPEAVNTFDLAIALKGVIEGHGMTIANGQLECFPNVKAFGRSWLNEFVEYQGHRLPLQPGSGSILLSSWDLSPQGAEPDRFWASWDFATQAQDLGLLNAALESGRINRRRNKKLQTPLEVWRSDLESEIAEGWTGPTQTNALLKAIATHGRVFLGLSGDELATYTADVARDRPGFMEYCGHIYEIDRKAKSWARSVEKYYYPPGTDGPRKTTTYPLSPPQETPNINKARQWDAKQRIHTAVCDLMCEGWANAAKTASQWAVELVARAKCSLRTLYRYCELWHPTKSDIQEAHRAGQATPPQRSVKDHTASDRTPSAPPRPNPNPYRPAQLQPALINGFTDLGGGMKSEPLGAPLLKKLIPSEQGKEGGPGGRTGNFAASTGA